MSRISITPIGVLGAALVLAACNQDQVSGDLADAATNSATPPAAQSDGGTPASLPGLDENDSSAVKYFDIQSGRITYEYSGMRTGTEIISWDSWGMRQAKEVNATMSAMGMSMAENQRTITTPETITTIDLNTNTATVMANPIQELMGNADDAQELGEQMLVQMGGVQEGSDTVLGKPCDIWNVAAAGTTLCVWKGATLRMDMTMMGMTQSQIATNIEENIDIDEALFEVPDNVTIQQMPTGGGIPGMPSGAMPPGGMPDGIEMPQIPGMPSGN